MCKSVYFRASLDWLVIVKILLLVFPNSFLLSWLPLKTEIRFGPLYCLEDCFLSGDVGVCGSRVSGVNVSVGEGQQSGI